MRGHRKIRLPQKCPRHGQSVDRIGLAAGSRRSPGLSHQLRGNPHHFLPTGQQIALQARGEMPAILDRPHHLGLEPFTGPHHRLAMPGTGSGHDLLGQLAADLVDGNEGMRALVYIGSNNNHGGCLLHCEVTVGPVGGHISVGAMPRSYQVTPAGPSHLVPTKRMDANPRAAGTLRARHQVLRIQPPQHAATSP